MALALTTKLLSTAKKLPSVGASSVAAFGPALGPTSPPPGSYDPSIDAQIGQSSRGLQDLLGSYITNFGEPGTALGGRAGADLATGQGRIAEQLANGSQDLNTTSGRTLADLLTASTRAGEDHTTQVADLGRQYARLGDAQRQSAESAGVGGGGALAQALAKRTENEAHDQAPIDTAFSRSAADNASQVARTNEDTATGLSRLQTGASEQGADLVTNASRQSQDALTGLLSAQRENTNFGLDANNQKLFQANQPLAGGAPAPFAPVSSAPAGTKVVAGVSSTGVKGAWHIRPDGTKVFVAGGVA